MKFWVDRVCQEVAKLMHVVGVAHKEQLRPAHLKFIISCFQSLYEVVAFNLCISVLGLLVPLLPSPNSNLSR